MTAWFNLFKKEFRLGFSTILATLIGLMVMLAFATFYGFRTGHVNETILIAAIIATFAHVFYLLFYMIKSLQKEKKKLHLWLHNPMPGVGLLLAKLLNGLVAMTITLLVTCIIDLMAFLSIGGNTFFGTGLNWSGVIRISLIILIHIYLISIYFAVLFIFFWMINRMLLTRIGVGPSIILTLVILGILNFIKGYFETTSIYKGLTHWGELPVTSFISSLHLSQKFQIHFDAHTVPVYFGTYISCAVVTIILFFISSWILDRKMEV